MRRTQTRRLKSKMKQSINKQTLLRLVRFGFVGAFNTVFDLAVLNFLIYIFGEPTAFVFSIYKGISFLCALICSYFLNKHFTFKKNTTSKKTFLVFVFFSLIGFVANVVLSSFVYYILLFYSDTLSIPVIASISAIVGSLASAILNYITYSYFVFK